MILKVEDLKQICSTVLAAVDSNELSIVTETLEIINDNSVFTMNVTNREYYTQVRLPIDDDADFHATVNANLFLKLMSQITTDTVEFTVTENNLIVRGNGTYKIPLIFDDSSLLELPKININNVSCEFDISSDILNSILVFNGKQLNIGTVSRPVQKMYYVDNNGAITFTTGACVNSFSLEQPVKMLFNSKLVKLFKLFKDSKVHFKLGHDAISDDIIQTKVEFNTDNVTITSILFCDDSMISSVPVDAIRNRANSDYSFSVVLNKDRMLETINRFMLFTPQNKIQAASCKFEFTSDSVIVNNSENTEIVTYENDTHIESTYKCMLDLFDLKSTLESCNEQYVTVKFGDGQAIVITRCNVSNVIPELREI